MDGVRDDEGMTMNQNTCAACKHQRRRCDESCELAHYFPASRYEEFQHAYKHFGLSNMVKIMNWVQPHQRQIVAETLLFEGNARFNYPVHGCAGVIQNLQSLIRIYDLELQVVNQQLSFFKGNNQRLNQRLNDSIESSSSTARPLHDHPAKIFDQEDDSRATDRIMDLNQNGTEITSVPSETEGKHPPNPDDDDEENDGNMIS